jgi:hypothetical protein
MARRALARRHNRVQKPRSSRAAAFAEATKEVYALAGAKKTTAPGFGGRSPFE